MSDLIERFNAFAARWVSGSGRGDGIYSFTDKTGTHEINASDLVEAAAALTANEAEIARLREALVEAAIPLEALFLSHTIKDFSHEMWGGIVSGIEAAHQALATDHVETSGFADCESTVVGDHTYKTSLGGGNTVIGPAAKETSHDA